MSQPIKKPNQEAEINRLIGEKSDLIRKLQHEMDNVRKLEQAVALYQTMLHQVIDAICPKVK
jgi:hypothetical protein